MSCYCLFKLCLLKTVLKFCECIIVASIIWATARTLYTLSLLGHNFRDAHDLHSHPSLPQTLNAPSLPIYLFLSFVFSILPVGFRGTSPKKIFRGRLYFGSFSQY